jgi:hypothetical protein
MSDSVGFVPVEPWNLGRDFHRSVPDFFLRMYGRYQNRVCQWSVLIVGPEGESRQLDGGPMVPGPHGLLIPRPSVISAYRGESEPVLMNVEEGDRIKVNGLLFDIRDDRPHYDPCLVAVDQHSLARVS